MDVLMVKVDHHEVAHVVVMMIGLEVVLGRGWVSFFSSFLLYLVCYSSFHVS